MMTEVSVEQSLPEEQVVSLDEAVDIAVLLQSRGHLAQAKDLLRRVLEKAPEHPRALHFFGVLAHQEGRSAEAVPLVEKSLQLASNQADWHSNLGIILKAQGRLDEAARALRRAIALDPHHANAYSNLGLLLRAQGDPAEAEAAFRRAVDLDPRHTEAYTNLGNLLTAERRVPEALECYCKVITLNPKHPEGRRLLAFAHATLGRLDKALEIYQAWIQEEPENPIPRHMLAACSGRDVPPRASDAYVETVFNGFATGFESRLAHLSYRAPSLVAATIEEAGVPPSKSLDVLDMGCGTGLCGVLVAPYARRLVGVDLSAGMLAQAREKKVYGELVKGELTRYLRDVNGSFDLIVSADTLVYFGALDEVVTAAAGALRPGGLLVFTLEELTDGAAVAADFSIRPHGRYNHARTYVERVLAKATLRPHIVHAELRMEGGFPVGGLVVRAAKAAGADHA